MRTFLATFTGPGVNNKYLSIAWYYSKYHSSYRCPALAAYNYMWQNSNAAFSTPDISMTTSAGSNAKKYSNNPILLGHQTIL